MEYKVKLTILVWNEVVVERKSSPRVDTTYTLLELININIGVAILLETLGVLAVVVGVDVVLLHRIRERICLEEDIADNTESATCGVGDAPPTEVAVCTALLWTSVEWPELVVNALLVDAHQCA